MESISDYIQSGIIIVDKICDYIPYYSIGNNLICLVAKSILFGIESFSPSFYTKIQESHLVKHLDQKNSIQCVLLCIPYLNIVIAFGRDFGGNFSQKSAAKEKFEKDTAVWLEERKKQSEEFYGGLIDKQRKIKEDREKEEKERYESKINDYQTQIANFPDTVEGRSKREHLEKCMRLYIQTHQVA